MKVNIKGLVFTGFAAAILSANAMAAAGDNIVTSKSYVDAHDNLKVNIAQGSGNAGKILVVNSTGDLALSENTISADLNTKQDKDTTEVYKVGYNGGWVNASNAVSGGTYITATANSTTGATTLDVKATTDEDFTNVETEAGQTGTDDSKLPTARAVKAYVDSKADSDLSGKQDVDDGQKYVVSKAGDWEDITNAVAVSGAITKTVDADTGALTIGANTMTGADGTNAGAAGLVPAPAATDNTKVLTGAGTYVAKQVDQGSVDKYQVSKNGAWVDASGAVSGGTYVTATPNTTNGSTALDITATTTSSGIANASNNSVSLTTDYAVQQYVTGLTGGLTIPAQDSSVCTASQPCALVDEAGNLNWRTMATASDNGGACGNASGTCPTGA